ncbi:MAG: thioredoxin domain-containing protein [Pseudomonadota bacterium]
MINRRQYLASFLTLASLGAGIFVPRPTLAQSSSNILNDTKRLTAERYVGAANAPVTIIEFSSMTCPHCATFHAKVFPEIEKKYIKAGVVRFVFRDFPLDSTAAAVSMLLRCVPEDRYEPFMRNMFKEQKRWTGAAEPIREVLKLAQRAGLSRKVSEVCLDKRELFDHILERRGHASKRFNVNSTPTFVIYGGMTANPKGNDFSTLRGVEDLHVFDKHIRKYLK